MVIPPILFKIPNTFRSQITTTITTTTLRILFILLSMGIKVFTSHNKTPTTIKVIIMVKRGIQQFFS
jgi:hypothetical protein